jgi:hypothetical protein
MFVFKNWWSGGCLPVVARHLRRVGLRRVFTANSQKRSYEIACIGDIKKERHWSDLPLLPAGRTRARSSRSRAHLGFRSVHVERALRDVCARKLCMHRDPECQAETREEKSRSLMSSSANGARGINVPASHPNEFHQTFAGGIRKKQGRGTRELGAATGFWGRDYSILRDRILWISTYFEVFFSKSRVQNGQSLDKPRKSQDFYQQKLFFI